MTKPSLPTTATWGRWSATGSPTGSVTTTLTFKKRKPSQSLRWWFFKSVLFPPRPGIGQEADPSGGGVSDQGRGSGCSNSAPARIAPVVRTVCYIAAELVRLVSCVESMKPVLQSLYHRILLYPPPQHRTEAIRIMKEVGGAGGGVIAHS